MTKDPNQDFFRDVYDVVALIPEGRVTSYGAIAKYLGAAKSSRVVGWALNGSITNGENIPAHRVVNRLGMLSGKAHFSPPSAMQEALEAEGITVKEDKIQNFKECYWDPNLELEIDG
ncbi:MAG: MGMT family protein [Crocinitomicaceae bacterium]|nr:MGMT family protein [Crocinitomicaceae bacterium]